MHRKVKKTLIGVVVITILIALVGCGSSTDPNGSAGSESYKSPDGWIVQYDPSVIEVKENESGADFIYTGESAGNSMASIRFIADKQPEEVLYEVTSAWDNEEAIVRSEGFFPGTTDKWGFWRVLDPAEENTAPHRTAIAGEYNGGVLLLEDSISLSGNEENDIAVSDALANIVDSITYENFEDQVMYEYVPGTYTAEQDGAIHRVTLNADHTGVLDFQDSVDIFWGSIELNAADHSFSYEYTIEGENLMINYDGNWLTFRK